MRCGSSDTRDGGALDRWDAQGAVFDASAQALDAGVDLGGLAHLTVWPVPQVPLLVGLQPHAVAGQILQREMPQQDASTLADQRLRLHGASLT